MSDVEVALTELSEIATKELVKTQKPVGLKENVRVAKVGGHTAKVARDYLEENIGSSVVTKDNKLNYRYNDTKELE